MPATLLLASSMIIDQIISFYKGARSKTISWEMFVFVSLFMAFDTAQCVWIFKLALPFEVTWKGWTPAGLRRTRWTKRERATRRLEGKVNWTQRGLVSSPGLLYDTREKALMIRLRLLHLHSAILFSTTISCSSTRSYGSLMNIPTPIPLNLASPSSPPLDSRRTLFKLS
jgi:hypothetical protein